MGFNLLKVFQVLQTVESQTGAGRDARSDLNASFGYLNRQAIVKQPIQPYQRGRVRFWGSDWFARCDQEVTLQPGEIVDVVDIESITLIVEPAFLLAASYLGATKVRQAWQQRGWRLPDLDPHLDPPASVSEPVPEAAQVLMARSPDLSIASAIETWQRFLQAKPIYITKFKLCCELLELGWHEVVGYGNTHAALERETHAAIVLPAQSASAAPVAPLAASSFVGRSEAIRQIDRLASSGANLIAILGEGGLGKTTLAKHYFSQGGFDRVLECWMAKQTHNITSAQSLVQDWLQRYFAETPASEFAAALEQLRQKLQHYTPEQAGKIGILIDNLEPALDRHGQFIAAHQDYVALLEVLSDPTVRSLTLITSREPLRESTVQVQPYSLPSLDAAAWQEFFTSRQIQANPAVLGQIHRAYGGNAKAMTILCSTVSVDYAGSLSAFWQEHQTNLLQETDLEELVTSQFDRLQQLYPDAYRLLLRLGCYRYQDVSSVPIEGLFCLLWDVPASQHRCVVRFLEDLFLVEVADDRYALHPVIQAKAISLLQSSSDWQEANRRAAACWTEQVQSVQSIEEALAALEAYYHLMQIHDLEAAALVLLYPRDSQWQQGEPLGVAFYRLGLLQSMIGAIVRVIDRVEGETLSRLCNILGDLYWLSGNGHAAIRAHQRARDTAQACHLQQLELVSLYNIGLCRMQLWELEDALTLFNQVNALAEGTEYRMYAVGSWFCLAYLNSCLGRNAEALEWVKKVLPEHSTLQSGSWVRGYSLLFVGMALKNLGDAAAAARFYQQARDYAEQSQYVQVKAGALNGLATIAREQMDFRSAIANHLAARRLLERLEARADLAEVYYQLGLTYLKMNELTEAKASLNRAIDLFHQMRAPKQIARVHHVLTTIA